MPLALDSADECKSKDPKRPSLKDKNQESIDNLLKAPAYLLRMDSNETLLKIRKVVNKIKEEHKKEKDYVKIVMKGSECSTRSGFHWYIEPDSAKYTVLRYSRAICIFANFTLIPLM